MIGENNTTDINNENLDLDMTQMLDNIHKLDDESSKYGEMSFLENQDLDFLNSSKLSMRPEIPFKALPI